MTIHFEVLVRRRGSLIVFSQDPYATASEAFEQVMKLAQQGEKFACIQKVVTTRKVSTVDSFNEADLADQLHRWAKRGGLG